jgi:hypothetical protein
MSGTQAAGRNPQKIWASSGIPSWLQRGFLVHSFRLGYKMTSMPCRQNTTTTFNEDAKEKTARR